MGVKNSSPAPNNYNQLFNEYEKLPLPHSDCITFLEHKITNQEFLLRQITLNSRVDFQKTLEALNKKVQILGNHRHIVPLKKVFQDAAEEFCSTHYRVYALFEFPLKTLEDEINERNLQKRQFEESQLWSLLACSILASAHLQKNSVKHGSLKSSHILIAPDGTIKLFDPITIGCLSNYDTLLTHRATPHIYLSPQQVEALLDQKPFPFYHAYKSDVWTLAVIILEAGLLQYQDECYRDQCSRIHWETLHYNIKAFQQAYSSSLADLVTFMLSKDQKSRPDWLQLQQQVNNSSEDDPKASCISQVSKKSKIKSQKSVSDRENGLELKAREVSSEMRYGGFVSNVSSESLSMKFNPKKSNKEFTRINLVHQNINGEGNHQGNIFFGETFGKFEKNIKNKGGEELPFLQSESRYILNYGLKPVLPSDISRSRPLKNFFPPNHYQSKTKIDQNLSNDPTEDEKDQIKSLQSQYIQNFSSKHIIASFGNSRYFPTFTEYMQQQRLLEEKQKDMDKQSPLNSPASHIISKTIQSAPLKETVSFTTPQSRPKSEFVAEIFLLGSKYQGYKVDGLRQGYGKFYYQDGGYYEGEWSKNKMEGTGKLYYQSGKLAYEGQWKNDKFSGKGKLYNQSPSKSADNFDYRNLDNIQQSWVKYEGEFFEDMKQGAGVLYLSNNEYFQGTFFNDVAEGTGVYTTVLGLKIRGIWRDNHLIS